MRNLLILGGTALADEVLRGLDRPRRSGLSRAEELDLLAQPKFLPSPR